MGRGPAPSPPPQVAAGSRWLRERRGPLPAPLPGAEGHRFGTPPIAATRYGRLPTCGYPALDSPGRESGSRGLRGFKLPQRARPGTDTELPRVPSRRVPGTGDGQRQGTLRSRRGSPCITGEGSGDAGGREDRLPGTLYEAGAAHLPVLLLVG